MVEAVKLSFDIVENIGPIQPRWVVLVPRFLPGPGKRSFFVVASAAHPNSGSLRGWHGAIGSGSILGFSDQAFSLLRAWGRQGKGKGKGKRAAPY